MKPIIQFGAFQVKATLRSWKTLLGLLLIPFLLLSGIGVAASQIFKNEAHIQQFAMAIVDQDQSLETKLVIEHLTKNEQIAKLTSVMITDETAAREMLRTNEIAAMVMIPKDFSSDVKVGINTPVKVVGNPQRPLQSQMVKHIIESAANYTSAAQSGINTIYEFVNQQSFSREEIVSEFNKSLFTYSLHILGRGEIFDQQTLNSLFLFNHIQYYALSFFILLLLIWSYSATIFLNGHLNESIRQRLLSRGMTPCQLSIGLLLSSIVILIPFSLIVGIPLFHWIGLNPFDKWILLGMAMMVFSFTSFFILLEALLQKRQIYQLTGISLVLFLAIVGGHVIPTIYLPEWMASIGDFTPNGQSLAYFLSIFEQQSFALQIPYLTFMLSIALISILLTFIVKSFLQGRWKS